MIDWLPTLIISAVLIGIVVIAQRSNKRKKKDTTDGSDVDDIPRLVELSRENDRLKTELSDAKLQIGRLRRGTGSVDSSQLREIKFPSVTKAREAELKAMDYREYLQTPEWKKRVGIMKNWFGNRCQACYSDGVLHVHHRTYRRRGNEHSTDLTVLCRECHQLIHDRYPELGK